MAVTKLDCAGLLKLLADETRLSVVRLLIAGPCSVSELIDALKVEQTLLSHHLRSLREGGVIEGVREGKSIRYSLSKDMASRRRGEAIDLGCCQIVFKVN